MATAPPRLRACIPARLGLEPANKTLLHHLRLLATPTRPPRQYPKREETFAHRQPNLPTRQQLEEEDDLGPEAVLMDLAREGFKQIGKGPERWCVCEESEWGEGTSTNLERPHPLLSKIRHGKLHRSRGPW